MLAVTERETLGKIPYGVVEEGHICHFEHTEFKVSLIYLRQNKHTAGHITHTRGNTSIAFHGTKYFPKEVKMSTKIGFGNQKVDCAKYVN